VKRRPTPLLPLLCALLVTVPAAAAPHRARHWEDVSYGTGETDFTAVAVDPENPRRLFAGAGGSLYLSTDGGLTWRRTLDLRGGRSQAVSTARDTSGRELENEIEDRVQELREEALEEAKKEIADETGMTDDAAAEDLAEERIDEEEDRLRDEARAEVLARRQAASTGGPAVDAARAFGEQAQSLDPRRILRLEALAGGRLLAATTSSLRVSDDRGETFDELVVGQGNVDVEVRAAAGSDGVLYAGTPSGLFRSTDGGAQWAPLTDLPPGTPVNDLALRDEAVLVASEFGVWRSADRGITFVPVLQPGSPLGLLVRAVAFDEGRPQRAFAGTVEGLYRSDDGGESWRRLEPDGLLSREVTDVAAPAWGLVVSTVGGVFVSTNGGETFSQLYEGLDERNVRRVAAGPQPEEVFAATARGLFVHAEEGERVRRARAFADVARAFENDPPVEWVMREALRTFGLDRTVADWSLRAGRAPWAPRLTLGYQSRNPWGDGFSERTVYPVDGDDPSLYLDRGTRGAFQGLLLWDAARIVFNPDALDAASVGRRLERLRERVLRRVVTSYDARRRRIAELVLTPPDKLKVQVEKTLQLQELEGVLDLLTDGRFTAALAADARRTSGAPRTP
jgi:photosystem II stability/assembly factor-like uncharacterized protein